MPAHVDPDDLTPEERLRELAVIFARGVRTLQRPRPKAPLAPSEESTESAENGLDSGRDVSPHVDTG